MIQELIPEVFPVTNKKVPHLIFDQSFPSTWSFSQVTDDLNVKVVMLLLFVKMEGSFSALTAHILRPWLDLFSLYYDLYVFIKKKITFT